MKVPLTNIPTRALVVDKAGSPFILRDVTLDEVRDTEVLVEIKYTGLCHTDLVVQQGLMPVGEFPAILGHEGAGIIRRIGLAVKDHSLQEGDIVLLSFSSCKNCSFCATNRDGSCPHITEINFGGVRLSDGSSPARLPDGTRIRSKFFGQSSFSKLAVVSETSIVKCDLTLDELSFMAPMGCGFYTGAATVMRVLKPVKESALAVFGMGAVGLSALMAAKALGVKKLIAVDILDTKLDLATSLGATHTINSSAVADMSAVLTEVAKGGVNYIIDTTGMSFLIEQGVRALCHAGTFALVGVPRPNSTIAIDTLDMLLSCKKLIGVIEGDSCAAELIPELINLQRQGQFPIEKLSKVYPVASLDEAFADLKSGKVVKPVLSWDSV